MTHLSEAVLNRTKAFTVTSIDPLMLRLLRDRADFLVLDACARAFDMSKIARFVEAAGDVPVLVRTDDLTPSVLQKYLALGIDGLILGNIHYASEAEKAIAACLYPPEGTRPFAPGPLQQMTADGLSLQALNDQLTLVIEIAHPQTVAQIDDIAEVTGVNGFLIAPKKLAVAMERGFDTGHADVAQAIRTTVSAATAVELPWGWEGEIDLSVLKDAAPSFHIVCSDFELVRNGLKTLLPEEGALAADDDDEGDEEESGIFGLRALR